MIVNAPLANTMRDLRYYPLYKHNWNYYEYMTVMPGLVKQITQPGLWDIHPELPLGIILVFPNQYQSSGIGWNLDPHWWGMG